MSDIREEFERTVRETWSDSYSFMRDTDGHYGDEVLDGMWWAWQAARAQGGIIDIDQVALDTIQAISEIDPDKLKGGKTQATARAQCYVIDAIERCLPTQGDAEPVAYISHTSESSCLDWFAQFDAPRHTPLYTHPPKAQAVPEGWTPSSEGPTGWEFRFVEALRLLCGGSEPSDRLVKEWLNHGSEDLQAWVASETALHWSMGITTIEAAMSLADEPDEGGDHFGERPQPPQEGDQ